MLAARVQSAFESAQRYDQQAVYTHLLSPRLRVREIRQIEQQLYAALEACQVELDSIKRSEVANEAG